MSEYDSPINTFLIRATEQIAKETDQMVYEHIERIGSDIDKKNLVQALTADKERYEKAYDAGYRRGKDERYVMCKDCKHYDAEDGVCDEICHKVGDEDYCSFGEIKEIDEDGAVIDG